MLYGSGRGTIKLCENYIKTRNFYPSEVPIERWEDKEWKKVFAMYITTRLACRI